MPCGFGRLPFIGRRLKRGSRPPTDEAAAPRAPIDPDLAPIGPPVLLPSAIIREKLFDATDFVPSWAMPRPEAAQQAPTSEPKATKRPRRAKASSTAKPATATTPRRPRKSSGNAKTRP